MQDILYGWGTLLNVNIVQQCLSNEQKLTLRKMPPPYTFTISILVYWWHTVRHPEFDCQHFSEFFIYSIEFTCGLKFETPYLEMSLTQIVLRANHLFHKWRTTQLSALCTTICDLRRLSESFWKRQVSKFPTNSTLILLRVHRRRRHPFWVLNKIVPTHTLM